MWILTIALIACTIIWRYVATDKLRNMLMPWALAVAIVRFVTPSLFAVYLLHVSNIGNSALVFLDEKCACVGYGGVRSIIVSTIVFVVCVAADMPRRALLRAFFRNGLVKVGV